MCGVLDSSQLLIAFGFTTSMAMKYCTTVTVVDGQFCARVVRRRTSRGTTVERERKGFASRQEAQEWAEKELVEYLRQRKVLRARRRESKSRRRTFAHECEQRRDTQMQGSMVRNEALLAHIPDPFQPNSPDTARLLRAIRSLPGNKIVTVATPQGATAYDIAEDGAVGYVPGHEAAFLKLLDHCLCGYAIAGLMIRQFIPGTSATVKNSRGEDVSIPWKALYGVQITGDGIRSLPAEEVEHAATHAADGSPTEPENYVIFEDFSVILARFPTL